MPILFNVSGSVNGTQNCATFDVATLPSPLILEQSNTVLLGAGTGTGKIAIGTVASSSVGNLANVFANVGVEFIQYEGVGTSTRVGFAGGTYSNTADLGTGANCVGILLDGTGKIYRNNVVVATLTSPANLVAGKFIHISVHVVGTSWTFKVYDQTGALAGTYTDTFTVTMKPAASLPVAGRLLMNCGQRRFDVPGTTQDFLWIADRVSIGSWAISSDAYYSTPPFKRWRDDLLDGSTMSLQSKLSFFPWGASTDLSGSNARVVVSNDSGLYDPFVMQDARDASVTIQTVAPGALIATATTLATLVLDTASVQDDSAMIVNLRDQSAVLYNVAQNKLMPPNADTTTANKIYPFINGVARSVSPLLLNSASLTYVFDDYYNGTLSSIAKLSDKGYALNPAATPADYTSDLNGLMTLARTPVGILTADIISFNAALATQGGVASATSTATVNFPASSAINGDRTCTGWGAGTGGWSSSAATFPSTITVAFASPQRIDTIVVVTLQDGANTQPPLPTMTFTQFGMTDFVVQIEAWNGSAWVWTTVATVTGNNLVMTTYTFAAQIARSVRVTCTGSADAVPANKAARVVELEAWTAKPYGSNLKEFVSNLALRSNLFPQAPPPAAFPNYVTMQTDLAAIDTAWGYVGGIGCAVQDASKCKDLLQIALDTHLSSSYFDAAGVLRTVRLIAPETVVVGSRAGSIGQNDMIGDLILSPDYAVNLSTQAGGQRNYTQLTDFSTDVSITPQIRSMLSAKYRLVRAYSGALAEMYAAARQAPIINTLLDSGADVQKFIDYVCGLYKVPRYFSQIKVNYRQDVVVGQVWTLTYSRYGMSGGIAAFLVSINSDPIGGVTTLTFWHGSNRNVPWIFSSTNCRRWLCIHWWRWAAKQHAA